MFGLELLIPVIAEKIIGSFSDDPVVVGEMVSAVVENPEVVGGSIASTVIGMLFWVHKKFKGKRRAFVSLVLRIIDILMFIHKWSGKIAKSAKSGLEGWKVKNEPKGD